jgi:tRNA dimethylallyltransferase
MPARGKCSRVEPSKRSPPSARHPITACKAIGIREIRDHLAGKLTHEQTIEAITIATRQYAKRQATWFRRETCYQTICLDSASTAQFPLESALRLLSV